jgi:thiosulfate reductase cytochrome b subunit
VDEAVPVTVSAPAALPDVSTPQPATRTVMAGTAPGRVAADSDGKRRPNRAQVFGAIGFGVVAVSVVFLARAVLGLPAMHDFLARFPGEYATPAAPGIAPWVGWQHFFNMFLMVLVIRSGLGVRHEKRPEAYWTSRNGKTKISLTLWLHQSLDILWLANGVVFVVLLFLTGHWARLIPTSWEVFPNALSAALQYISFEWPVENGWNNYNSLQQLAYFTTVFIAAPLAAISGFRMSGLWPKQAERLSKAYRVEWARAVHYPVMLYFMAFIAVHVALVVLTGFLRNLNHMYASQDTDGWLGFWIFVGSIVMIAAGWVLTRTSLLSPVAGFFGKVSSR